MLQPDFIPSEEPEINVGIILPEDDAREVQLEFPVDGAYTLLAAGSVQPVAAGEKLTISFSEDKFIVQGASFDSVNNTEIIIRRTQTPEMLSGKSGIKVGPVVAGRGFHWQKMIDVYLPDNLWFRVHQGRMTLINQMHLEHYVMCVATSEMGAACPEALIESQTIAARSWILANVEQKHIAMKMDVCNDDCCQRYQGTSFLTRQSAVGALQTSGKVVMYQNTICDARYSKSCGGMMESFDAIWDGPPLPYLQVKPDTDRVNDVFKTDLSEEGLFEKWVQSVPPAFCSPHVIPENELIQYLGSVDEEGAYFRWETRIGQKELIENLKNHAGLNALSITGLKPLKRAGSGRITKLEVDYINWDEQTAKHLLTSEYQIRQFLSSGFLYSSAISIRMVHSGQDNRPEFHLKGAGWGHGVGFCQIGALGMSLKGYRAEAILMHYFPGSTLVKLY